MTVDDLALFNKLSAQLMDEEVTSPVAQPIEASDLFDTLDLSLRDEGIDQQTHEQLLSDLVTHTPKTSSSLFFNQLFGGRRSEAILGDLLSVMLNNSMYTYKVAGPMVGVEKAVIRAVNELIGYPAEADGTFASGGSMTNLMAMLMARDVADPTIRMEGGTKKLTLYTSAASHYSIPKNAAFMGIGRNQIRFVPTNSRGQMIAHQLESLVQQDIADGYTPFFVNATAGTTVLGSFDSIEKLQPICERHNIWLHVDGAYCGSVLFSEQYRHLIRGIEKTNSFSFNAHKMLNTTLTCSVIVTREKQHLYDSFAIDADYLYQTDADEYNLGKTSLQCGRRNDALKLWTLWKSIGTKGLAEMVENQFYLADVARAYIRNNDDYELYSFDDSISICFNYKGIDPQLLCTKLYEHSELMVGFGTFNEITFVRLVTINASNSEEEILTFFRTLEAFANAQFSEADAVLKAENV